MDSTKQKAFFKLLETAMFGVSLKQKGTKEFANATLSTTYQSSSSLRKSSTGKKHYLKIIHKHIPTHPTEKSKPFLKSIFPELIIQTETNALTDAVEDQI